MMVMAMVMVMAMALLMPRAAARVGDLVQIVPVLKLADLSDDAIAHLQLRCLTIFAAWLDAQTVATMMATRIDLTNKLNALLPAVDAREAWEES
jgi:hypothetical protein